MKLYKALDGRREGVGAGNGMVRGIVREVVVVERGEICEVNTTSFDSFCLSDPSRRNTAAAIRVIW